MLTAAALIAAVFQHSNAQAQPAPGPTAGAVLSATTGPTEAAAAHDLSRELAILADPTSPPDQRDDTARRLVSRHTPEARDALQRVLSDLTNLPAQTAAARAIAD